MKLIKPNYKKNIVNVSATFAEFLGCPNDKPTLNILSKELKKDYKNIVFIILDGLGINPIKINLSKNSFLRQNIKLELTSTFPSTTANATTSFLTNQYTMEHGWFGWCQYFQEINQVVDVYLEKDSYTHEPIEKGFVKKILPKEPFYKKSKTDYEISVDVPDYWHDDEINRYEYKNIDEMISNIEKIANKKNKQFIYTYCFDPDATMHKFGVSSEEAKTVINKLNIEIEKLSKKLKNTLFVITADHGQIDIDGYVDFYKDNEMMSMLEHLPVFEPRATGFFVKEGFEKEFQKKFKQKYGRDFKLFETEKLIKQNYFGGNFRGENARFLPTYISVGTTNKLLMYNKDETRFKGHHTSLTDEMLVPLIIVSTK